MKFKKGLKIIIPLMVALVVVIGAVICGVAGKKESTASNKSNFDPASIVVYASSTERLSTNYTTVSKSFSSDKYAGNDVVFAISDCLSESSKSFLTDDSYGYLSQVVSVKHNDEIEVKVRVPKTALYYIGFDYLSYDSSILPIEFSLLVDGEYPFYECRNLSFETTWISDENKSFDRYGNEIVTLPKKLIRWEHKKLSDASYRYSLPLAVELKEGERTFTIKVNEGTFLLGNITLSAPEEIPVYSGADKAEGTEIITIEGEDFSERNNSSIHAVGEFDASVTPSYVKETILNTVDESSYCKSGQRITYEFEVKKAGFYNVALNYRQAEKNGFPVFLDIRVDGGIPNTEFKDYPLAYSSKYTTKTLTASDGNKLSVYLEEGKHTISFTISEDPIRYALEAVDAIMSGISDLSLEVTKVAGTNKDKYRDLKIGRYIPDIETRLMGWVGNLRDIAKVASGYVNAASEKEVAAFSYLLIAADQLESLAKEPNELVYRVDELSTSTNSINTQIANFVDIIGKNNVALDKIYIYQEDANLKKGQGVFASVKLSAGRFFNSFFGQSYSTSSTDASHIQVWVNRPRQYVEIMQKMIDDEFTPATGIQVDLSIITDANKLILSNASGDTPDIATGINYSIPFELGIRGALVDLTKFDNYKEVFGRYSEGILVPSVIGDGLYSLPETMNFYVLFYRKDILGKLGLSVPQTMDELIAMLPDLQMRGLNVFYPTASMQAMRNFHGVTPLIFQNGGKLYGDTARDLLIDSEETVTGFTELTDLFTIYNLPVDVPNFYQHFRNGDLPMGIADFNAYNLILNAAPEIENSWGIALIPGVVDSTTNEINRYMSGGAESTVMFSSDDEREKQAWEFDMPPVK